MRFNWVIFGTIMAAYFIGVAVGIFDGLILWG